MKPVNTNRPDLLHGLAAIAGYMGVKDRHTIIHWRDRLGFPLFLNPSALLSGRNKYYTSTSAITAWEHGLANATAQAQGREYDPSCPCPVCGRSDAGRKPNIAGTEEGPTRETRRDGLHGRS